jgi:filamentous hemagglutinin family protein
MKLTAAGRPTLLLTIFCALQAAAQIRTDASLGRPSQQLIGPNYLIPETLGKLSGNNLFQSFQSFDLRSGESASFSTVTPGIANVISRVTGGQISQINGKIQLNSVGATPDFYFINPAGVVFGAGAAIDVPGAFMIGSADSVKFREGRFNADLMQASTFSSAAPEAFGFLGSTRGSVTLKDGATLTTQNAKPIAVYANNVEISGATLGTSNGGDIRLVALGQTAQDVAFTGNLPAAAGNLAVLSGGSITTSASGAKNAGNIALSAGTVVIDAKAGNATGIFSLANSDSGNAGDIVVVASGNITLANGAQLLSMASSSGNAGAVTVNASDLSLTNGSLIASVSYSSGKPGTVSVSADSVTLDGQGKLTGIYNLAGYGLSQAGVVTVSAAEDLTLVNGGVIASAALASGDGGTVKVSGGRISIDGQGSDAITGIYSAAASGTGNAGDVEVNAARNLTIANGGVISSATLLSGNAGSVKVSAASAEISGKYSGILSEANPQSTGHGGDIEVHIDGHLAVVNGGRVSSSTYSSGQAGTVTVVAGSIAIDKQGNSDQTGIFSEADGGTGSAGNVTVKSLGSLAIANGGLISSSTWSSGVAGAVSVDVGSIAIDGKGYSGATGVYNQANPGSTGNAGSIHVVASGAMTLTEGGVISSSTWSPGFAGTVSVEASSIVIDGKGGQNATGFYNVANSGSTGNAGDINVRAQDSLSIVDGGLISSSTSSSGMAGTIAVGAGSLAIDGRSFAGATGIYNQANFGSTGNAGKVSVATTGSIDLLRGGVITSGTFSSGKAGAISVLAGSVAIDRQESGTSTGIFSQAEQGSSGDAGDVNVLAAGNLTLSRGGVISSSTYSSARAGTVTVGGGQITIDGKDASNTTGIFSDTNSGTGDAGDVQVVARTHLTIIDGGTVTSSTYAAGHAGTVKVSAGDMLVDGQGAVTGIFSNAKFGTGSAGNVEVNVAGTLTLNNGGQISSDTLSAGEGGKVKVHVGNLVLANGGQISSNTRGGYSLDEKAPVGARDASAAAGNAGDVEVAATGSLTLTGAGRISSNTESGSGNAGAVTVRAGTILIDGMALLDGMALGPRSEISASAGPYSTGQAGRVKVTADVITLSNGGQISITSEGFVTNPDAITPTSITVAARRIDILDYPSGIATTSFWNGAAGSITVSASEQLQLRGSSISTEAADGNGGAIKISGGILRLNNAKITTSVWGREGKGNGGDIGVQANALILDTGFIQANTAANNAAGGAVAIDVRMLVPSGNSLFVGGQTPLDFGYGVFGLNVIQAAAPTGLSGTIQIASPALDISGSLTGLNTDMIDTGGLGRNPCQVTGGSSLSQPGRGGLPASGRGLLRGETAMPTVKASSSDLGRSGEDPLLALAKRGCA